MTDNRQEQEIGSFVLPSPDPPGTFRCGLCRSTELTCRIAPGKTTLICTKCGNFAEWVVEAEKEEGP